jgi:hypothetical protein
MPDNPELLSQTRDYYLGTARLSRVQVFLSAPVFGITLATFAAGTEILSTGDLPGGILCMALGGAASVGIGFEGLSDFRDYRHDRGQAEIIQNKIDTLGDKTVT